MPDNRTILVVDDDQTLREALTAMLDGHGYRTIEADDGHAAQQMIDAEKPDLVILDMMMPRWGGLAVLEHFRDRANAPPFIMITANEGAKHKSYAEQLGVVDYICKPFSMERLLDGVTKNVEAPAAPAPDAPTAEAAPATVRCRCPGCGSRIKAPIQLLGQTRTCPRCRVPFTVVFQPEDEGPILLIDDRRPPLPRPSPRL